MLLTSLISARVRARRGGMQTDDGSQAPGSTKAHDGEAALSKRGRFRAQVINLAIHRHEQLDGLYLCLIRGKRSAVMHVLVGKILDRVTQDFQCATGLEIDVAAAIRTPLNAGNGRNGNRYV